MRTSKSFKLATAALVIAASAYTPVAMAATANTSLGVTALVLSTCVATATPVIFGNYTFGLLDNTGSIVVTCTPDVTSYSVALDAGTGTGATTANRKLTFGSNTLNYHLYSDTGRTSNWGNVLNTDTVASSAATLTAGVVKTFTVFGRLPANQTSTAGAYADTVQVTVNY